MNHVNDFHFTPTSTQMGLINVPYFEDARSDFAPYYDIRNKTLLEAQREIMQEMSKLGAGIVIFEDGYFGKEQKRYGYRITFNYGDAKGLIRAAGLPIKQTETEVKLHKVRLQALMNVRDWLKATVTGMVFAPGSDILIPHLLIGDTGLTIADHIASTGNLPRLNPPTGGAA